MTTVTFLLSKHPYAHRDGETAISRLLLEAASRAFTVRAIALTGDSNPPPSSLPIEEVAKPPLSLARVVPRSLLKRRSAIHERFCSPELVDAVSRVSTDRIVARRLYMAEAAIESGRDPDAIVEVLESDVLRRCGGVLTPLLRLEARRTAADERRCMRAARSLACLGDDEGHVARTVTERGVPRLDLALPPHGDRPPEVSGRPLALYLGDRTWGPNRVGLARMYGLWPAIRAAVPAAELLVVGRPGVREPSPPAGVRVAGFIVHLDGVWSATRVLLAPIPIGGGVRVKILEAAARGVPVVGTTAAIGSIGSYLPLAPVDDDASFVEQAVRLLRDAAAARRAGEELWIANARHVAEARVERALEAWLG